MGWLSDGNPEELARLRETQRNAFEERIIKKILGDANVDYHLATARHEASLMNGGDRLLTFDWFQEKYPMYPVRLGAAKIPRTHEITCGHLFGHGFTKLPFYKEFINFLDQADIDMNSERAALVFNWTGIKAGGSAMVIHNYPTSSHIRQEDPDLRLERGTRIVRPFGYPPVVYVIESLNDFLLSVGKDWIY
jgi:hypothetical protein